MFHAGDLQSGISLAISQQRTVACFVTDDGEESKTWEEQWLQNSSIANSLASRAVILRIEAGSQEAGFLAAFCSIDKAPSLVLIHNGQLRDNITAGVGQEELSKRVLAALGEDGSREHIGTQQSRDTAENTVTSPPATQSQPIQAPSTIAQQPPATPPAAPAAPAAPPSDLQSTFPDRASQHEAKHRQQQDADKAKAAAAKARRDAEQAPDKPKTARNDYAAQQRQRLAEAKKDRDRVMAQIEADKQARKQRERERKEAEQATMSRLRDDQEQLQPIVDPRRPTRRAGAAANANIQVRLFSGRTLRQVFPATATLDRDLRSWVDEAVAEDVQQARPPPYIFKHILNPLPSRTIEVGEESQSLADLEMLPSATLVLVPVQGEMADAFGGGAASGVLGLAYGAASGAVGLVGSTLGWGASTLGSIVGISGGRGNATDISAASGSEAQQSASQVPTIDGASERQDGSSKIRVRTLADRRADEAKDKPETWYNGNQTSYQPKDDPGEGPS